MPVQKWCKIWCWVLSLPTLTPFGTKWHSTALGPPAIRCGQTGVWACNPHRHPIQPLPLASTLCCTRLPAVHPPHPNNATVNYRRKPLETTLPPPLVMQGGRGGGGVATLDHLIKKAPETEIVIRGKASTCPMHPTTPLFAILHPSTK